MTTNETTSTRASSHRAILRRPEAPNDAVPPALDVMPTLHANGVLFKIDPQRLAEMKNKALEGGADPDNLPNLPRMNGSITDEHGASIPLSMFVEAGKDTGVVCATLSLGGKDRTKFYGKLFRSTNDSGPDYSGFIVCLPVTGKDQYDGEAWNDAPRLQVCGWRRRSANGSARISLAIAPRIVGDDELPL